MDRFCISKVHVICPSPSASLQYLEEDVCFVVHREPACKFSANWLAVMTQNEIVDA